MRLTPLMNTIPHLASAPFRKSWNHADAANDCSCLRRSQKFQKCTRLLGGSCYVRDAGPEGCIVLHGRWDRPHICDSWKVLRLCNLLEPQLGLSLSEGFADRVHFQNLL